MSTTPTNAETPARNRIIENAAMSRFGMEIGLCATTGGGGVWRWVQTQETDDGIPQVLRDTLERNEAIWSA